MMPIVLNLDGQGIKITPLSQSNAFFNLSADGTQHHTAWAAAGNGVLFYDPTNSGKITQADQVVFTQWDPSAKSDMQALLNVFDTNHNGKLDAGDAAFANFKIMVTNSDGTTTAETLTQAGVTSINLNENAITQTLVDGSTINGETTFTKSDGTTGTAATVILRADSNGYLVQSTTTKNADGSTTIDNKAFTTAGIIGNETISTVSADGLSKTLSFDDAGNGIINRVQSDVIVRNADGSVAETLSDFNGSNVLQDRFITTTSADGKTISTQRNLDGGGFIQQTEIRATNADSSVVDTLTNVNKDGSLVNQTVTSSSADELTRTTKVSSAGNGVFDLTIVDATIVNTDSSRNETITQTNADGSMRSQSVTLTSATGRNKTAQIDTTGNGVFNLTTVTQTVTDNSGGATTTITDSNVDGSRRDQSITSVSADGLSKFVQADIVGNGVFDVNSSDVTVGNANGSKTETIRDTSANGNLLFQSVTTRSADGLSRTVVNDSRGDGTPTSTEIVTVAASGIKTDTLSNLNADGSLINQSVTTTSRDGFSITTQRDLAGSGVIDQVTSAVNVHNADGSSTQTIRTLSANGALLGERVIVISADSLNVTTQADNIGLGVFDTVTNTVTVNNADGSRTLTQTNHSTNGTLLSSQVTNLSANRKTSTIITDTTGDGYITKTETINTGANGTITDNLQSTNADGSLNGGTISTTSANGLDKTVQIDSTGNGSYDHVTTDNIALNPDGSRTETVSNTAQNGVLINTSVTTTSANGLVITTTHDDAGNNVNNLTTVSSTLINADDSHTQTVTDSNANGSERGQSVTTTSANGFSSVTTHDFDGNGTIDLTTTSLKTLNADGSYIITVSDANANGLRDNITTNVSADSKKTTVQRQFNGSVNYSQNETSQLQANGNLVDTLTTYSATGADVGAVQTTTSANGLSKITQVDVNGDGIYHVTTSDVAVLNLDGSRVETIATNGSAGLIDEKVVTTSGNGLSSVEQVNTTGGNGFDLTTTAIKSINADGSTVKSVTDTNQDGSVRDSVTTSTSSDRRTVVVAKVFGADGKQSETAFRQSDGQLVDTISNFDANGVALGTEVTTTNANGLSKTMVFSNGAGVQLSTMNDIKVINIDGSVNETVASTNITTGTSSTIVTTTSANGLSKQIQSNLVGLVSSDTSTSELTTLNSDGSTTQTVTDTNVTTGTVLDSRVQSVSADGLTTSFALDGANSGTPDITSTSVTGTDGSKTKTTTILNSATSARQQYDVIVTSADGRTINLSSARNGDTNFDHFETIVINANNSVTDTSSVVNSDGTPNYKQIRTETFNPDGSKTVNISDYDGTGLLQDQTSTTTSATGLSIETMIDATGTGVYDESRSDITVIGADGSRTETIIEKMNTPGAVASKIISERVIISSADGRNVTTMIDGDGNGQFEQINQTSMRVDGSMLETISYYNNITGAALSVITGNNSQSPTINQNTSSDGLAQVLTEGDITATKTLLANANGSYKWSESSGSTGFMASSSHQIDANQVDTWTSSANSFGAVTSVTVMIDVASERVALGRAEALYYAALGRAMFEPEIQGLNNYIQGNSFNIDQLAKSILYSSEFQKRYSFFSGGIFVNHLYLNAFGHVAGASDLAKYVDGLSAGTMSMVQVLESVAQKAVDETSGNGLIALTSASTSVTPSTVSGIPTGQIDVGAAGGLYEQAVNGSISNPMGATGSYQVGGLATGGRPITGATGFGAVIADNAIVTATGAISRNFGYETVAANSSAVVTGTGNFISADSQASVTVVGNGNEVDVTGTGAIIYVSNGDIVLENNATATIVGNDNKISTIESAKASVSGINNVVTNSSLVAANLGPTVTTLSPNVVEQGQSTIIGTVTPGVAGDALVLTQAAGALGTVSLATDGSGDVIYTAPSTVTVSELDAVSFIVTDQKNNVTSSGSSSIQIDQGPTVANLIPSKVGRGTKVTIGTVNPGLVGDSLSITQMAGSGIVAIAGSNVIYTAPTVVTASQIDQVSYAVKDQHGAVEAKSSLAIVLDPGPTVAGGTLTIGHGKTQDLTSFLDALIAPGLSGDKLSLTSASGNAQLTNGALTYAAPASGADSFTYGVSDQLGDTASWTVNVIVDTGPVVNNITSTVKIGASLDLTSTILAAATPGIKGDSLRISADNLVGTLGSVTLVNGHLTYSAPSSAFSNTPGNQSVTDTFQYTITDQYGDTQVGTATMTVTKQVSIINGGLYGGSTIEGTNGDDIINAFGWNNIIYDNGGNDIVNAGSGNATVFTSSGDVVVNLNGYGDIVSGGDGYNNVSGSQGNASVSLVNGNNTVNTQGYNNVIKLGNGTNVIVAGAGSETVALGSGNDTLSLAGYNNLVTAGNGNDVVKGGDGNETLTLGNGNNMLSTNGYNNQIHVGNGNNMINSGAGNDIVTAGSGNNNITIGGFNDAVSVGSGTNTIAGGAGNDIVAASGGNTTMTLAGWNDHVMLNGGVRASVFDIGNSLRVDIGASTDHVTLNGFAQDSSGWIDLLNGSGGFANVNDVLSALHSDGHGGTMLALGTTGSIDFAGVAQAQLKGQNFKVG